MGADAELPQALTIETAHGDVGVIHAETPGADWARALERLEESDAWDAVAVNGYDEDPGVRAVRRETPVQGVRAVVHGHWAGPQVSSVANRWWIDTGAGFARLGRLTLMVVNEREMTWTSEPTYEGG